MTDMDTQTDVQEKIIYAAIACIEEYGLQGATIRRIAEKAGQNSAAINYYFRSKDKLLEKAVELTLKNAFDWNDYQVPEDSTATERLELILTRLVLGAQAFPGLTRAHFHGAFVDGLYNEPGIKSLNEFMEEMLRRIKPFCPDHEENELRLSITQMMAAALLYPALLPKAFDSFYPIDFNNGETLKSYIHRIVTRLF
jgi:AcrR family transcriptional regulator